MTEFGELYRVRVGLYESKESLEPSGIKDFYVMKAEKSSFDSITGKVMPLLKEFHWKIISIKLDSRVIL